MNNGGGSVVELTTGVNSAVEQLRELGEQLSCGESSVTDEDLQCIDEVIAALRELDARRLKAHELLEAETIKASVLRHSLATFPHKLKAELQAALSSAREGNAAEIHELQDQLSAIADNADRCEKKQEVLELHNEVLIPEQKRLQATHTELVKKLNETMSKKAQMQIRLNETEDKLKKTNNQVSALEEGMERLQAEMSQARQDFASEKKTVLELVGSTKEMHRVMAEKNEQLQKEVELLQDDVVQTGLTLSEKTQALNELDASIARLLALEEDLKLRIQEGIKQTADLERKGHDIVKETEKMRQEYAAKKKELLEKARQFNREVELASAEIKRLSAVQKGLHWELKQAQEGRNTQSRALADIQQNVVSSKKTLLFQSEEGARLTEESRQLDMRMGHLKETHQVNVQLVNGEIAGLREQLAAEQSTRQTVEENLNQLLADIECQKLEHSETISTLTTKMNEAQQQHGEISHRNVELESAIESEEKALSSLSQQLQTARSTLCSMKSSLQEEIQTLEENIADLTEELSERNETLSQIEPECKSLEEDFAEKSAVYESKKKDIIALKNKRAGLEDQIQRIERQLQHIHIPQEKLRLDTLRCRAYTRRSLAVQGREVGRMEGRVIDAQKQLTAVTTENKRIEEACEYLEGEIGRLRALYEGGGEMEEQLDSALKSYRAQLEEQWKGNQDIEELSSGRDRVTLADITSLREASEQRLQTITGIHDQFDQQLEDFSQFLHNTASLRARP